LAGPNHQWLILLAIVGWQSPCRGLLSRAFGFSQNGHEVDCCFPHVVVSNPDEGFVQPKALIE